MHWMFNNAFLGRRTAGYLSAVVALFVIAEVGAKLLLVSVLGIRRTNYENYYRGDEKLNLLTWSFKYSPHPYFGYESPEIRAFERQREHRSERDYIIGVLGGSVAEMFANYARAHLEDFEPLRAVLPEVGDKRFVIANLALGGGHQPQQFFIGSFFSDDVDLFITIDGFNEMMIMSSLPRYPLEFPSVLRTPYERTSDGWIYRRLGSWLISAYEKMDSIPLRLPILSRSNLYFSLWYVSAPRIYALFQYLQGKYHTALSGNADAAGSQSTDQLLERKVAMWRRYAALQNRSMSGTTGKRAFVFLQPNQYLKDSKNFSEVEKTTAVDPSHFDYLDKFIRRFKKELDALQKSGVSAYDLTEIFQHTDETVYIDRCCHLNSRGNEIMSKSIVAAIVNHH